MRRDGWWCRFSATGRVCRTVALVAGVVALLRVAFAIPVFTNVVDEPFHLAGAVALWDVRKHTLGVEHPPLPRLVAGLPLYVSGVRLPPEARGTTVRSEPQTHEVGARILFDSPLSYRQILHRARLAMLVFPALALLYLYLLARRVGGNVVAMLAVMFFSVDATLLGHAMWVTTDAAACAGFLAASYHGLRWIDRRRWGRAVAAGIALGLAIACKFTCMLVIPGLILLLTITSLAKRFPWSRTTGKHGTPGRTFAQLGIAGCVAFVALWATYLFDFGAMSDQTMFRSQSQWQKLPAWVRETPVPMPSFPLGVLRVLGHNRWGHPAYLNGEIYRYGRWYYFPEVIALKSPLALLAGLGLAGAVMLWTRGRGAGGMGGVLVLGGLFLAVAMMSNLNIGVRHVLPVIPLLYLFACATLVRARAGVVLVVLAALAAAETASVHPDYLAFFNVAAGGPARGERFVLDSNLDWGQDAGRLAAWLRSEEAAGKPYTLRLFAHPKAQLVKRLGLDPAALALPPAGLFAISKNVRHGLAGARLLRGGEMELTDDYSWLSQYPRVKHIGHSIEVYDLSSRQLAHTMNDCVVAPSSL